MSIGTGLIANSLSETISTQVTFGLAAHLEATYTHRPWRFSIVLDPQLQLYDSPLRDPILEPGLTETYGVWQGKDFDVSFGLERLPLEYTRLSLPYSLESVRGSGKPQGLLGTRAVFFSGDWRLRPALLYRPTDDQLGGALSVRKTFRQAELEAHLTYLNRLAIGLGGSGLLGDSILYGDLWLLLAPMEFRGALGASGFWGDALWTLEAAYAPSPLVRPETPFPQLLAQISIPQGASGSWEGTVGTGLVDSLLTSDPQLALLATAGYSHTTGDSLLFTGGTLIHTESATVYTLQLRLTGYF